MLSKLKVMLGAEPDTRPALQEGEEIILAGRAERVRFLSNPGWGFSILTNRRLVWHEPAMLRLKWRVRVLNLIDIATVDRGNMIHFLLGGRRLRLRLRDGKSEYLFQGGIEDTLGEWVTTIGRAIAEADGRASSA